MMKTDFVQRIIVTSDEPWCDIWHTQLHYAFQLSKRVEVIFLGPPTPWSVSNLWKFRQTSSQIKINLVTVTYHNYIPSSFGSVSLWINDKINEYLLRKYIFSNNDFNENIVWHFDSHRSYHIFQNNKNYKHVFHVIDPIAGCNLDLKLANMADLIVVTSPKFVDHYKAINNNVIQVGQGVDLDFYKEIDEPDNVVTEITSDSILLLGTISDQLDFNLLISIAEKYQGKLVLIGPDKTQSDRAKTMFKNLLDTNGVHWLGVMDPGTFRKHLNACRVGLIAYDSSVNYKNEFRSPLKVISYLACGKCIISNIDCEIPSLINQAIYNVTDADDYFNYIDSCYNGQLAFNSALAVDFLNSIDYNNLLESIFNSMGEQLPPIE